MEGDEKGRAWLRTYMARKKMTWPNVAAGGPQWYPPPFDAYDVSFLPFNLLLDREGGIAEIDPPVGRLAASVERALALDSAQE